MSSLFLICLLQTLKLSILKAQIACSIKGQHDSVENNYVIFHSTEHNFLTIDFISKTFAEKPSEPFSYYWNYFSFEAVMPPLSYSLLVLPVARLEWTYCTLLTAWEFSFPIVQAVRKSSSKESWQLLIVASHGLHFDKCLSMEVVLYCFFPGKFMEHLSFNKYWWVLLKLQKMWHSLFWLIYLYF